MTGEWLDGKSDAVRTVCSELDGIPLAIELAARQARILTPGRLLKEMEHPLGLLRGGYRDTSNRHSSMHRALPWSYESLGGETRSLFERLAVFESGFDIDEASAMAPEASAGNSIVHCIGELVDRHLLMPVPDRSRFGMLRLIREYGLQKLGDSGGLETARRDSVTVVRERVTRLESSLYGPEQLFTLTKLDEEAGNSRATLALCRSEELAAEGLAICAPLGYYWLRQGKLTEAMEWLSFFCSGDPTGADPQALARASYHLGWVSRLTSDRPFDSQSEVDESRRAFGLSLDSARAAQSLRDEALAQTCLAWVDAHLAISRRYEMLDRKDKPVTEIHAAMEEAIEIATVLGDPFLCCQTTHSYGSTFIYRGDHLSAEPWFLRCLEIAYEIDDPWSIIETLHHLAWGYMDRGL